ncbi:hypothetical protein BDZ94DRAFT_1250967 [Collybia nuda]|uniref:Uncharacterized protein n=1 Tax=Collybia nuda TaxID=64659 RepID=A0A9P6CN96_9AGAR|nr:hypothetical protein BDZ94DRAFT_1250967 [Collybia nuda]
MTWQDSKSLQFPTMEGLIPLFYVFNCIIRALFFYVASPTRPLVLLIFRFHETSLFCPFRIGNHFVFN